MSVRLISRVWEELTDYEGDKLIVLLALADWANDDGVCWPSVESIAKKARITERGAFKILAGFRDDGVLELVEKGGGRGKSSRYRLVLDKKTLNAVQALENQETLNLEAETLNGVTLNPERRDSAIRKEPLGTVIESTVTSSVEPKSGSPGGVKPEKLKANQKHVIFMDLIHRAELNFRGHKPVIDGAAAKHLARLIKLCPELDPEGFKLLLTHYHYSTDHGPDELLSKYLPRLPEYRSSPLGQYRRALPRSEWRHPLQTEESLPGGDVMAEIRRQDAQ